VGIEVHIYTHRHGNFLPGRRNHGAESVADWVNARTELDFVAGKKGRLARGDFLYN
jgi:hypothetical protein